MANYAVSSRHHFKLTAPAADSASGLAKGDVMGYTCIPDPETGAPFYKELDGKYLVDLFYNTQAEQVAKNPQEDLPIVLSDWRSGFGLNTYDYSDPKRYFASYGADLRRRGRALLSYGATAISLPTYGMKITDPGLETWTSASSLTNWTLTSTAGTIAVSRQAGGQGGGTYFARLTADNTEGGYISQTLATWNNNYRSKTVTIKYYGKCDAVTGRLRLVITDGVDTTNGTWRNDTSWTQYTETHALNAAATELTIRLVGEDNGAAQSLLDFDGLLCDLPYVSTVKAQAVFNDLQYFGVGNCLFKLNGTGDGLTFVKAFSSVTEQEVDDFTVTDMKSMVISGTDYLFIALGTSNPYQYMVAAETFTESNAATSKFQFFQVVYTTALTMYGNDTNSTIRSTVNPLNGGTAWSSATQVDNDYYDILELFTKSGALYIRKEDMPYYLNSAGAVQNDLAPECLPLAADTQDRAVTFWQNEIFYAAGASSFLRIGTTNEWINPSDYCNNLSDFVGRIFACAGDDRYLYIVVDNSTKVEILAGRDETVDGTTSWVWHPIQEITLTGCEITWVSSIYQKRLWIASDTSGESLYYIPLPTSYGNIENDTNRSFATGGNFETPWLHGRFPADTKAWLKVVGTSEHAYAAGIYWQIQYKKLGDSTYTNIGNLVGTSTDRTHTLYLPVDASSNDPVSPMMRFKLIGVTNDTTKTPILLSLNIQAILYATRKDIIWAKVKIAKEMITKGGVSKDKFAKLKACLDVSRDATYPVTLVDIDGTTTQVRFLELPSSLPWREPVTDETGKDYDYIYNCLMLKTPTS